jgi:hypothetical protein
MRNEFLFCIDPTRVVFIKLWDPTSVLPEKYWDVTRLNKSLRNPNNKYRISETNMINI